MHDCIIYLNICKESYQVPMFLCQSVLCPQTPIILHFTKIKIKINDLYITRSWQIRTGQLRLSWLLFCNFKRKKLTVSLKLRWHLFQCCTLQPGFVPFFRDKFPGPFQDSDWFFKDSKIHINPYTPKISMLILLTAFHTIHIFSWVKQISRTFQVFQDPYEPW